MSHFIHLHTHSNYSFCRGANSIHDLCAAAQRHDMSHLALTETNGLYGLGWFLEAARDFNIKPIIGAHLVKDGHECLMLAQNLSGYQFLCNVISRIHHEKETDLLDLVKNYHDVFLISNDIPLLKQLVELDHVENLFGELRPFANREAVLKLYRHNNIPPVATNGVYFVEKADWRTHQLLRAIDLNTTLKQVPPDELAHEDAWFRSAEEMAALFPDCPEAIDNTLKIAQACEFDLDFGEFIFPQFQNKQGDEIFEKLVTDVNDGILWRYGEMTPEVQQRRDYELDIIKKKGFAAYFLVLADVAKNVKLTCGRGSAAASLVSYTLGITHVDPLKFNLFFERFLNEGRQDPPDIDVDFAWDERDTVLKYLFTRYGPTHTAMIANHNTFKARSAVREIAKVHGLADGEIGAITKKMNSYWQPNEIWQMTQTHPVYKETDFPPPWPDIIALAEKIRGFPRHMSLHCGGVVIAPKSLDFYVPYQPAKKVLLLAEDVFDSGDIEFDNNGDTINVIQWEKDQSEDMKLVKMDILGNRSLAVIRDALKAVKDNYDVDIDYTTWNPNDDLKTIERFYKGDTMGVFYFESPATRQLLKKVAHGLSFERYQNMDHFSLNVVVTSIIRPASNQYIQEWVKRLHGEKWQHLHPSLEKALGETLGVMVYQEQMSQAAMAMAEFNAADADMLRKIVNKKHKAKQLRDFYRQFVNGARQNKVEDEIIEKVWQMIMSFDGYSFCKPHSASYTLVAYKSAFLRAHYPAEFMAAVLSNRGGYYSTFAYISEAKRMGLAVLMPDINESQHQYVGKNGTLRVGLMQLKGLSHKAVDAVLAERRNNGKFKSFDDVVRRVNIAPSDVKILIKAGCFDSIENAPRPQMLWRLQFYRTGGVKKKSPTLDLFDETPASLLPALEDLPKPPEYEKMTILRHEIDILGFLVSQHPLSMYRDRLKTLRYVQAKDLHNYIDQRVRTVGWLISGKTVSTKKNQLMEFISFEDTTALYETTFFPDAYAKFVYMLSNTRPYMLEGLVEENFGAVMLTVEHVSFL